MATALKPMNRRCAILSGIGFSLVAASPVFAAKLPLADSVETRDGFTLVTHDLSPRFLDFYAAAQGLDADARFAQWRDRYGFAAVPPGPRGEAMARALLDTAWPNYANALPLIRAGAAGMAPRPLGVLVAVGHLLAAPTPMRVGFTAYVGGFETNAFTMGDEEGVTVSAPIEMRADKRALMLPHEMTHGVHMLTGKLSRGFERSLGRVVFEEGLAMRATQRLVPGHPDFAYVGDQPWFEKGLARRQDIMAGLLPALDKRDFESVMKFTFGQGSTGIEREAYIAGWLVVGRLLKSGKSFGELARMAEADLPGVVGGEISELLM